MGGKYYWDEVIVYRLYLTSPARLTQYIVILIDLKVVILSQQTPQVAPEFNLRPFLHLVIFYIACSSFASSSWPFLRFALLVHCW